MDDVFLDFRSSPIVPITEMRSTIIILGIQAFRAHGLFDRYSAELSPAFRETLFGLVAGVWIPVDVAMEHYRTSEKLDIDPSTHELICNEIADRAYKHVLSPVFAQAKRQRLTAWESLALAHQNNDLNNRGGDIRITKEGPRQALHEWAGQPCASVPYFVRSYGMMMRAFLSLFCLRVAHCVVPERSSPTSIALRLAWTDEDNQGSPSVHPSSSSSSMRARKAASSSSSLRARKAS